MYAVLEDRTQQYRVAAGDRVLIDLMDAINPGDAVTFDKVCLLTGGEGGEGARIGAPYVDGASVTAKVVRQDVKGPKLVIQKFRRRKNSRKKTGFRARYTEIQIEAIHGA
ncbi:MAG: 50S ribosomal protein L21 [Planctomycetota bacterium]|jgi:large subunit ribosomal protein L21|nr:50S ribosomal protein L21 [Planctomycetota bacterium]MDA0933327.1 50S ribosomal protein L21 [Planctomycetota bacterium]MDA1223083.1 50S ribosomal protein L21 [Planctomycetota bacterium]